MVLDDDDWQHFVYVVNERNSADVDTNCKDNRKDGSLLDD